jgi:hypothetical protein
MGYLFCACFMLYYSVSNLQYWADNVLVVRHSLELFNDLSSG